MQSSGLNNAAALLGRLLLAAIFIQAGWGKIGGYEGTVAYMTKSGVPGSLLPIVIAVELLGGLLIVVGWQTRLVAVGLAIFTLLAAYLFHMNFGDRNQTIHFMKIWQSRAASWCSRRVVRAPGPSMGGRKPKYQVTRMGKRTAGRGTFRPVRRSLHYSVNHRVLPYFMRNFSILAPS